MQWNPLKRLLWGIVGEGSPGNLIINLIQYKTGHWLLNNLGCHREAGLNVSIMAAGPHTGADH